MYLTFLNSVPADQIDAVGHWAGNTRREVYGSKIPKIVSMKIAKYISHY